MLLLLRMTGILVLTLGLTASFRVVGPQVGAKVLPWQPDMRVLDAREQVRRSVAVDLAEFRRLYENGAIVIDARSAEDFGKGHLDAPMIINIPEDQRDQQQHLLKMEALRGNTFVIYCSSVLCDAAVDLYLHYLNHGFGDIRIYLPGWDGIQKAGLPTSTGPEFDIGPLMPPPMDFSMEPPPDAATAEGAADE